MRTRSFTASLGTREVLLPLLETMTSLSSASRMSIALAVALVCTLAALLKAVERRLGRAATLRAVKGRTPAVVVRAASCMAAQ
jgi:hypothetical protein